MRHGLRSWPAATIIVFNLVTTSAFADEDEARRAFKIGVEAFEAGEIQDALKSFERAYALRPSYKILFNIAQAQAELGHTQKAIDTFEKYLEDGGEDISQGRRIKVEEELNRLRAKMTVPERLPPRPGVDAAISTDIPPPSSNRFLFEIAPWISTGLAGATLISGIALGAKAAAYNKDLGDSCIDGSCPPQYDGDIDSMKKAALAADIMFVATGILTAAAVSLFIIGKRREKKEEK